MVNLEENQCTGCSACYNVCPVKAIQMRENENGEIYPHIDLEVCIRCDLCERQCPELHHLVLNEPKRILAAVEIDDESIISSASGGAAFKLSERIIATGGVVYGCALDDVMHIHHKRCENITDVNTLRGSKYVHSHIGQIFKQVKDDLISGRTVLFIGTPCQVAGLKAFLRKVYGNLYTVDLICHGVPSQKILRDEIKRIVGKSFSLDSLLVSFRWKILKSKLDPIRFGLQIFSKDYSYKKKISRIHSPFMAAFFSGYSYRENCHNCQYSTVKRIGDITIGDFWGLGKSIKTDLDITKGVSMIMVNTHQGEDLLNKCNNSLKEEEHSISEAILNNRNLSHPTPRPCDKSYFREDCKQYGLKYAVEKYIPSYNRERKLIYQLYLYLATKWHSSIKHNIFTKR